MPSKLLLVFNQLTNAVQDETVTLRNGLPGEQLFLRFVNLRTGQFQVTIGYNYADTRGQFRNSFLVDYNTLNTYEVEYGGTTDLEITHPDDGHFQQANVLLNTNAIDIAVVTNTPDATPISVTDVSYSQGSDPCNNVQVAVTTSSLATKVTSPVQIDPNTNNPFTFELPRGYFFRVDGENADGETFSESYITPGYLIEANMSVNVVNSPNGATATIVIPQPSGATLEYSINGTDWQSSNIFPSLTPNSYTAYVRDDLGCQRTTPFTVTDFEQEGVGVDSPIADLPPKSNSLRFYKVRADDELAVDENSPAECTPNVLNPKREIQKLLKTFSTATQLRSNYETITVTVTNENGVETDIPVQKMTDNVGLKDSRDALKYDLGDGRTGIYFKSGNIYEYGTLNVIGSYSLNGARPSWGVLGNFIYVENAWFEIVDIAYDEQRFAEVLIIDALYTGAEVTTIVSCIYNAKDYEVHEFAINWGFLSGNFFRVRIDETDTRAEFPDISFESEIVESRDSFYRHVQLEYYNNENSGNIMYSTGIIHKIMVPVIDVMGQVSEETVSDKSDTSAYLIDASVHEMDQFHFSWMSKGMMRKLSLALNHDNITIDGVGYVKQDNMEVEGVRNTNLYKASAVLIKKGGAFTTRPQADSSGVAYEVPNLITDDLGNFLKYE